MGTAACTRMATRRDDASYSGGGPIKAVVFHGPRYVSVDEVADPRIERPLDAVVWITTANICGSDLHPYEGRADLDDGMVLGHENMGIVEAIGPGVERVEIGDRVSVPFNLACGSCRNCNDGWTSACLRANPSGDPGAGYGYPQMGPYWGGQAELLRVPWADFNLLELPEGDEHVSDFTMLSDIFPTGYHGTELGTTAPNTLRRQIRLSPTGHTSTTSTMLYCGPRSYRAPLADPSPTPAVLYMRSTCLPNGNEKFSGFATTRVGWSATTSAQRGEDQRVSVWICDLALGIGEAEAMGGTDRTAPQR